MKKILILTMLFIYTVSVTGMNIQFHYCGGKIKSISLFHHGDSEKGCCGKKMKKDRCCNDKTTSFKLKDSHDYSPSSKVPPSFIKCVVSNIPLFTFTFVYSDKSFIIPDCHAPPVLYDNPLYLRNRVLLI
ncbi:MAG: hypothetical protein JSU07_01270 [Bacteroidetes bacterium]|nr:hypothetical protein [Bacteroidota bacterium]